MATAGIYAILNADATLKSEVGSDSTGNIKVYPQTPPQDVTMPFVVITRSNTLPTDTKDAPSVLDEVSIQIDCYSKTYAKTQTIKDRIRTLLDNYSGTVGGVNFDHIVFANEDEPPPDLDIGAFAVSQDYSVRIIR